MLNPKCHLSTLILVLLVSQCFAQYADTIVSQTSKGISDFNLPYKELHGHTNRITIEETEIHKSTFYREKKGFGENNISINCGFYKNQIKFGQYFLPETVLVGIDSLFLQVQTADTLYPQYLQYAYDFWDNGNRMRVQRFFPNGQLEVLQEFVLDTAEYRKRIAEDIRNTTEKSFIWEGKRISYYENGQLRSKTETKQGKFMGDFISYHSNGKLLEKSHLVMGEAIDTFQTWYENGERERLVLLDKEGNYTGVFKRWYKNGRLSVISDYVGYVDNDSPIDKEMIPHLSYYEDGKLRDSVFYVKKDRIIQLLSYYPNGQLRKSAQAITPKEIATWSKKEQKKFDNWVRKIQERAKQSDKNAKPKIFHLIPFGRYEVYSLEGKLIMDCNIEIGKEPKEKEYGTAAELRDARRFERGLPSEDTSSTLNPCRIQVYVIVALKNFNTKFRSETKTYCIGDIMQPRTDTFYKTIHRVGKDSLRYIFEIIHFKDRKGNLHYQRFYPTGTKMMDFYYKEPYRDEERETEYGRLGEEPKNGNYFFTNQETGIHTFYYANGQKCWEKEYDDNLIRMQGEKWVKEYYENGQIKSEEYYQNDEDYPTLHIREIKIWHKWYENGQMMEAMPHENGNEEGVYKKWSPKGVLLEQIEYAEGDKHGVALYYNEEGELIKQEEYKEGVLMR